MTTHIALLRAINVGGTKKIGMADLRDHLTKLGFEDARTLLQSGNVVLRGGTRNGAALERFLETETAARLGLETKFFVRTAAEWQAIIAHNPFPEEATRDPSHLLVMTFKQPLDPKDVKALQAAITGPELVRGQGREGYFVYPAGIGTSRLTIKIIEKKLGSSGTGRNWNTVLKLAALAGS